MPKAQIKLTKLTKSKRWRKKYKGVAYYLPFNRYPTRDLAWAGWLAMKAQLDTDRQNTKEHRVEYDQAIKERHNLATIARERNDTEEARLFQADADRLLQAFNNADTPPPLSPRDRDPFSLLETRLLAEITAGMSKEEKALLPTWAYQDQLQSIRTIYNDGVKRL